MAPVREARVKTATYARRAHAVRKAQAEAEAAEGAARAAQPTRAWFLIGETKATSAAQAEHEWGWTKTKTGWTDGAGAAVKFLEGFDALVKEAKKTEAPIAVYLGYRWYAVTPPHLLDKLVRAGHVLKMPDPAPVAAV